MNINGVLAKALDKKPHLAIAYLCTLSSIILMSLSLSLIKDIKIGPFGIVYSLPPLYYGAIVLSIISGFITVYIKQNKPLLQLTNLLFLLVALWLIPILLEGTPRFASSYKTIGFVEYIYREGSLNPANWELFYHNWPGFSILAAVFWMITGINEIYPIVLYYPFVLHLLIFLLVLQLLKQATPEFKNGWYVGGVIYLISNFVNQDYFSPQSYGYYLLSVIVILLISRHQWLSEPNMAIGYKLSLMLTIVTLAMSHILSSLVALAIIEIFFIFEKKLFSNILLFCLVVLITWTLFGAYIYFDAHISNVTSDMFTIEKSFHANIVNRVKGSAEHILVGQIRIIYAVAMGLSGFVGLLLYLKRSANKGMAADLLKVCIASIGVTGAFVYGGESFMRIYLLLLVPLAFFSLGYLYYKKAIILLFVFNLLAIPFHFVAHYGNEQFDYVSPGVIRGADFLSGHAPGGYITGYNEILGNTKYTEKFISLTWEQYFERHLNRDLTDAIHILGVGQREHNFWSLFHNNPYFVEVVNQRLMEERDCTLFYSNGEIDLFHKRKPYAT